MLTPYLPAACETLAKVPIETFDMPETSETRDAASYAVGQWCAAHADAACAKAHLGRVSSTSEHYKKAQQRLRDLR